MEKAYYLDLKTLLAYLRGKSAVLRTTITLPKQRQLCQGYVFLKQGSVMHCYVLDQVGTLMLEGNNALMQLNASTEWYVQIGDERAIREELLSLLQKHGLNTGVPYANQLQKVEVPRPIRALDATMLQSFSPERSLLLRTVFVMVNGERTVAQIKGQLRVPPEVVEEVLGILQSIGVIE